MKNLLAVFIVLLALSVQSHWITSSAEQGTTPAMIVVSISDVIVVPFAEELKPIKILSDVEQFDCNPNGRFICRRRSNGEWLTGMIQEPEKAISIPSAPPAVRFGAISNTGKLIAWITGQSPEVEQIMITDLTGNVVQRVVSTDQVHVLPSWSPNDALVAYYSGPSSVITEDGFRLMVAAVKDANTCEPKPLTPPSRRMGLSPTRTLKPEWHPSSAYLVFQGRFSDEETALQVVSADGKELQSARKGVWSYDGSCYYVLDQLQTQYRLLKLEYPAATAIVEEFPVAFPPDFAACAIHPNGQSIIFTTRANELHILDVLTHKTRKIYDNCAAFPTFFALR